MSDIVERLRKGIEWTGPTQDDTGQTENLMDEAADEIERLREWNREIALNAREFAAENERLRAALERLSCECPSNCDWEKHGDICPSWIARAALEEKP